jgi:hypothetical protein
MFARARNSFELRLSSIEIFYDLDKYNSLAIGVTPINQQTTLSHFADARAPSALAYARVIFNA